MKSIRKLLWESISGRKTTDWKHVPTRQAFKMFPDALKSKIQADIDATGWGPGLIVSDYPKEWEEMDDAERKKAHVHSIIETTNAWIVTDDAGAKWLVIDDKLHPFGGAVWNPKNPDEWPEVIDFFDDDDDVDDYDYEKRGL